MKFTKKLSAALLLFFSFKNYSNSPLVAPYYNIRSQGVNSARHAVGWVNQIHLSDTQCAYGLVSFTPEFTQSFNPHEINTCLFDEFLIDNNTMHITGSRVANRGSQDLLADYFYLPTDYESTVTFNPQIENFLVDFGLYVDLSEWACGLYFESFAPLVHTRWGLNFCENVINPGVNNHEAGYFTPYELDRKLLLNSFTEYINGNQLASVTQTIPNSDNSIRTVFQRLNAGRMDSQRRQQTRVADIRSTLGWNYFFSERAHAGLGVTVSAPTGNRVDGTYLFEPVVGNGHHWEFGGKIHALVTFWQSTDCARELHWYTDAYITHLFKAEQRRTFDLRNNGNLSRYILVEKMTTMQNNPIFGLPSELGPIAVFAHEFMPAANITHVSVAVGVAIQADITTMITYTSPCWEINFGYNFWARSREGVQLEGVVELATSELLDLVTPGSSFEVQLLRSVKGDAHVYGYQNADTPITLSASESAATIHAGTNFTPDVSIETARRNPNIDNPEITAIAPLTLLSPTPDPIDPPINTSIQPVIIHISDIGIDESGTTALSHKIFAHISHTWPKRTFFTPYFGIGCEAEFGSNKMSSVKKLAECKNGPRCSLSQWGVWAKGGILF